MADAFDPYLSWLGVQSGGQDPNHYQLLSLELFESDKARINDAADAAADKVARLAQPQQVPQSQKLLYQISTARVCLLNADERTQYDAQLRQQQSQLKTEMPVAQAPPPPTATGHVAEMPVAQAPPPASVAPGAMPSVNAAPQPIAAQPASLPTATLVGTAAATPSSASVVARVKSEHDEPPLDDIPTQPRRSSRARGRKTMTNETLILLTVLCLFGAGLGIYAIYLLTADDDPTKVGRKSDSTKREHTKRPKLRKPTPKPKPPKSVADSNAAWVDATASPSQLGQAKVSVIRAFAGPMPSVPGVTEYLYVQVRVRNMDSDKPLTVGRWESWTGRSKRQHATISDKTGKIFARKNPFKKKIVVDKKTLDPGDRFDQFIVFERPDKSVKHLRLMLAGSAVGHSENFRLLIPSSMISAADDDNLARLIESLPPEYRPGGKPEDPTPDFDGGNATDKDSESAVGDAVDIRPAP